ncbi:amidohydrolase [Subtercola sp. YIM 133946]|uniref:amidohydrolase n=1 Tax=Subtercola sp. YIM 133946 TaxID=3118909 RepID=UPI002F9439A6
MHYPQTVFIGGDLYSAGWSSSRRAALAVRDGAVAAIGSDDDVRALAGPSTRVVDLGGRMLVPGFHDAHAHPVSGGVELLQCDLSPARSAAECLDLVAGYAREHPAEPWIVGGGWAMTHFEGGTPTSAALDTVVADRPVVLLNRDHHGAWVNSEALRRAGIDQSTPDPADGRIERDAGGAPSGTLHEGAMALVDAVRPVIDQEFAYSGFLRAQHEYFRQGIVGWQDAYVGATFGLDDLLDVYLTALDRGTLTARITAALWWERAGGLAQLDSLVERRELVRGRRRADVLDADTVKIMVDGVAENFTAAMSSPYLDACGHPTGNSGLTFVAAEQLAEYVTALDAVGFSVHFHALGDRAVTISLDALEAARRANGVSAGRHHLAHLQVVGERDVVRFAELGATANLQMLWATVDSQLADLTFPHLEPALVERHYPFGDLVRAGTALAAGSDWPVSTADPLAAIHVGVNRVDAHEPTAPLGFPEQALDLPTALSAYTAGSATINGRGAYSGRLRVGYSADLAVLSQNPFVTGPESIGDTSVLSTWIDGASVYESE